VQRVGYDTRHDHTTARDPQYQRVFRYVAQCARKLHAGVDAVREKRHDAFFTLPRLRGCPTETPV
jgi:hypothetical protein